ncbi:MULTISPECIES: DUF2127 domain-containing protein [Marinomonas]|uniref:DUF2127 domain-containing protein n=1 Tax=Marinomonas rhodophyticola TaxID=2992803 RepID=A0ABT3KH05_9GAMM|nr:DUF2127 domain-containing protein [Marinomonas sp. KJ51-3]MCW4629828.1 DUF2127 domain-containing protein [Marinomonas sp. KJ51-3]
MKFEGLNAIALLEGIKGVLALFLVVSVNVLAGRDLHQLAEQLMAQWSISTTNHYVSLVLSMIESVTHKSLVLVTAIALLYACFRFVMAYGLWHRLRWTEWFAFISGSLYIPFELYALYQTPSFIHVSILLFNLVVVMYLYWVLKRGAKSPKKT